MLLGNKADKEDSREVPTEDGIELAQKEKYKFKETSCIKNENVSDAFEALIEMWNIENNKQMNNSKESINDNKENKDTERKSSVSHSNSMSLKKKQKEKNKKPCC